MAQLLENIAEYLETEGIGTRGEDIFVGYLVDEIGNDNVVMIDQIGGITPDIDLPIAKPTVQIIVRNADHAAGLSKIQEIFELIHGKHDDLELVAGGTDIMRAYAMNEPQHLDRDDEGRDLFTCTFVFQYRK